MSIALDESNANITGIETLLPQVDQHSAIDSPAPAPGSTIEKNFEKLTDLHGVINNFNNAAELVIFFDENLRLGKYSLHKWQAEELVEFSKAGYTSAIPYELALCAVNGSGKDKFFIAGAAVFFIFCQKDSYWVQTSSSSLQLETQTETYVRRLCESINLYYNLAIFDIKERFIKCNVTGSEMLLFRSDEEGKTEGHHPRVPGGKFCICVNEAKSVEDKIFEALLRCNGYTHWLEISSPGKPDGHFFRYFTSTRKGIRQRRITFFDCPHLDQIYLERLKEDIGENSPLFKSIIWAEFTSNEEDVVISYHIYNRCIKYPSEYIPSHDGVVGGLDLSGGGDEQSFTARNGNKIIGRHDCREFDLKKRADWIIDKLNKYDIRNKKPVYADAGGLGAEVIKYLHLLGYKNIIGLYNQSPSSFPDLYANLGTELWFEFKKLVEEQEVILLDEELVRKQLCNRYFNWVNKNNTTIAQLEQKAKARAKGHPSPDRADSVVLAFYKYKSTATTKLKAERLKKLAEIRKNSLDHINYDGKNRRVPGLTPPTIGNMVNASLGKQSREQNKLEVQRLNKQKTNQLKIEVAEINERLRNAFGNQSIQQEISNESTQTNN